MIRVFSHRFKAALVAGTCAGALLGAGTAAAQEGNSVIGPPQLRDFQLEPRQRIVTQPRPTPSPTPPAQATPQPTERPQARPFTPAPGPQASRPATSAPPRPNAGAPAVAQPRGSAATAPPAASGGSGAAPFVETPTATAPSAAVPPAPAPAPEPALLPDAAPPAAPGGASLPDGPPAWLYFLAFATLGLLGYGYWLRRRNVQRRALALPAAAPAPARPAEPAAPRPAPQPRPWIEVDLVPERASVDVDETVIEFELVVRNAGGTEARNVRLQARMFPSTPQQDKDINAYFKADEADFRTIPIPPLASGEELRIKGSVDMKQDRISALRVDNKLLFIPLIAVNARYDWGTSRSGHTARSWVIGREPPQGGDKMGAFRLDLGARVYRTVGRRPHPISRRV